MLTRFTNVYMRIVEEFGKEKKDFIILIDEPDLHLHLDWQRQYIQKLIDVFSTLPIELINPISLHFILATHSPFIISDLPAESLVLLENGEVKKYE
jgi:predicted ATP-dependent endonuclease of OLD family